MRLLSDGARHLARHLAPTSSAEWNSTFSQTKMITAFGRSGDVDMALELFEKMPRRNQVSYNAMLAVLLDAGRLESASRLFAEMPRKNARSYTSMLSGLAASGRPAEARRLFDSIPSAHRSVFSWTAMMSCYAQNGKALLAVLLFRDLFGGFFESKVLPNAHSFSVVLKCCGRLQSLLAVKQIHTLIVKLLDNEGKSSVFVQNSLVDVYAKLCCLIDAEGVFDKMKWKDLASWNTMMDGYIHNQLLDKAFKLFYSMEEKDTLSWNIMMSGLLESGRGLEALRLFLSLPRSELQTKPNLSTYTIVLTLCATHTVLEFGRQMHAHTAKSGLYPNSIFVSNSLVTMYANCGQIEELERVFDEMPKKDAASWNSVILGLGQNGHSRRALELAKKALTSNNFNANTLTAVLTSCSHGGLVVEGLDFFNSTIKKYGVEATLDHYICVVDLLGRAGMIKEAYDILRSMPFVPNSVAWSTLLNACSIHGRSDIGRVAAQELQRLEPDSSTWCFGLATVYSRAEHGKKSKEIIDSLREKGVRKDLGSSWVVEI